jgi:putative membrane protein
MADLRDYLAEERTFLAWIRTGLALMGFGFVVARFGLFLQEIRIAQSGSVAHAHVLSLWFGTVLIAVGVTVNLCSTRRHVRLVRPWHSGRIADYLSSGQPVVLGLFLALVGIALALYLNLVSAG